MIATYTSTSSVHQFERFFHSPPWLNAAATGTDGQRSSVSAPVQASGAEEGVEPVAERVCEGVNVDSGLAAVEGHAALGVVQKHAHLFRPRLKGQLGDGRRVGNVLASRLQAQGPEAVGGADGELPLAVDGLSHHPQAPLDLLADVHLPVAPPAAEALFGQHVGHAVEPLGVVRHLLDLVRVPHLFPVVADGQRGVGCL